VREEGIEHPHKRSRLEEDKKNLTSLKEKSKEHGGNHLYGGTTPFMVATDRTLDKLQPTSINGNAN